MAFNSREDASRRLLYAQMLKNVITRISLNCKSKTEFQYIGTGIGNATIIHIIACAV